MQLGVRPVAVVVFACLVVAAMTDDVAGAAATSESVPSSTNADGTPSIIIEDDPSPKCTLCKNIFKSLAESTAVKLLEIRKDVRIFKRSESGRIDEEIDNGLETVCMYGRIQSEKSIRSICSSTVDSKYDSIASFLRTWSADMDKKRSVIDSTAGMSTALDHREEHEFVRAACLTSLKLCKQLTDEPVIKNTVFHSQIEPVQMFPPVVSIGDVHPVTTSTIQPFILGEDPKKRGEPNTLDRDVLMYYGFPNEPCTGGALFDKDRLGYPDVVDCFNHLAEDQGAIHSGFYPTYRALGQLLAGTRALTIGYINVRSNVLHPPFDTNKEPALVYHRKDKKLMPFQLRHLTPNLSLLDLMNFIIDSGTDETKQLLVSIVNAANKIDAAKYFAKHQTADFYRSETFQSILPKIRAELGLNVKDEL